MVCIVRLAGLTRARTGLLHMPLPGAEPAGIFRTGGRGDMAGGRDTDQSSREKDLSSQVMHSTRAVRPPATSVAARCRAGMIASGSETFSA